MKKIPWFINPPRVKRKQTSSFKVPRNYFPSKRQAKKPHVPTKVCHIHALSMEKPGSNFWISRSGVKHMHTSPIELVPVHVR